MHDLRYRPQSVGPCVGHTTLRPSAHSQTVVAFQPYAGVPALRAVLKKGEKKERPKRILDSPYSSSRGHGGNNYVLDEARLASLHTTCAHNACGRTGNTPGNDQLASLGHLRTVLRSSAPLRNGRCLRGGVGTAGAVRCHHAISAEPLASAVNYRTHCPAWTRPDQPESA